MRLSMSVQYTLKDKLDGYRGLTHESITYGKERPVGFPHLMALVMKDVLEWYMRFEDMDTLNQELDSFRALIEKLRIEEYPEETG